MESNLLAALGRVAGGLNLSRDEMQMLVEAMMQGAIPEPQMALLLVGLKDKGETVEEIVGAAAAMRDCMQPVRTRRSGLIDTCGTGGDASGTFNISTAAALVVAAAGVPVAKHGNRRVTSRTGSADVLAELGVNIDADVGTVERCIDELGIGFCFAPLFHGSMRHVANVRRELGMATIFNLLGPLTNPAAAPFQVIGVGWPERRRDVAEALAQLGTQRAIVVCGADGLDEVTLTGRTYVSEIGRDAEGSGETRIRELQWRPADFGLDESPLDSLKVESAAESATIIRRVVEGESGPMRDIVVLNAAAALWTASVDDSPESCAALAAAAIERGDAQRLLAQLVEFTNS